MGDIKTIDGNDLIFNGHVNEKDFELRASEIVQYLFLGAIGLIMISILTTIVNTLISGGVKLILFSGIGVDKISDKAKNKTD